MLDLIESRPELARRKAAVDAIRAMPAAELASTMVERLARDSAPAKLYLKLLATDALAAARAAVKEAAVSGASRS
jgi:hypothetical protein